MKILILAFLLGLISIFMPACSTSTNGQAVVELRTIKDETLFSTANPVMQFKPAEGFEYVGSVKLIIKNLALAERHHWAVVENGRIKQMLVIQFEGFLDGMDGQYNFSIPTSQLSGSNFKFTDDTIDIDGKQFVHNTWAFDNGQSARDNPGLESAATLALLKEKNLEIDDALIMSRFALALGNDRRHELLLFYFEPIADHGYTLSDFPDGSPLTQTFDKFSDDVLTRSLESFAVHFSKE